MRLGLLSVVLVNVSVMVPMPKDLCSWPIMLMIVCLVTVHLMCSLVRLRVPEKAWAMMRPGKCLCSLSVSLILGLRMHLVQVLLMIMGMLGGICLRKCLSLVCGKAALAGPPGPVRQMSWACGLIVVVRVLRLRLCGTVDACGNVVICIGAVLIVVDVTGKIVKLNLSNMILLFGLVKYRLSSTSSLRDLPLSMILLVVMLACVVTVACRDRFSGLGQCNSVAVLTCVSVLSIPGDGFKGSLPELSLVRFVVLKCVCNVGRLRLGLQVCRWVTVGIGCGTKLFITVRGLLLDSR